MKVAIADESAIIIWDPDSNTEHFIRRATFTTQAKDFGFLVPTPTQPALAEAGDEAFTLLASLMVRLSKDTKGGAKTPVEVLDLKRVAGQDVAVLKSNDVDALGKWLTDHAYEYSPALKDWIKPYVDAKWIITASKIARDKDGVAVDNVGSTAVRMTFKTDKPFFPYSEPADQRPNATVHPARLLRIFFLGTEKMQGKLGPKGEPWPGKVAWASKVRSDGEISPRNAVLNRLKLPVDTPPAAWYLTVFEDRSSPRPGTADVYFSSATDQNPVRPDDPR
jgi:hypothetical protein